MSVLIDHLLDNNYIEVEINGKWYVAKPYDTRKFISRFEDAIRVLRGKSYAYHYREDRF